MTLTKWWVITQNVAVIDPFLKWRLHAQGSFKQQHKFYSQVSALLTSSKDTTDGFFVSNPLGTSGR